MRTQNRAPTFLLKFLAAVFLVTAGVSTASAQDAAAPAPAAADVLKVFASSADIQALIAQAKADRKGDQPSVSKPILRLAPYRINLEYRPGNARASVHEHDAEMMYVIEGAGTIVTGGKLVEEKRTNAANLSGKSIEGGNSQPLKAGDFLIVPENTPHQIAPSGGAAIVLMTFHVPRPVPGK
jgi:mannose-6-phosphate isomerase-like protein (cupin superfamily)